MKNSKLVLIIVSVIALASIILVAVFYSSLPASVGMQISSGGQVNNYVPKSVFAAISVIIPILIAGYTFVTSRSESKNRSVLCIVISVLMLLGEIMVFTTNLHTR